MLLRVSQDALHFRERFLCFFERSFSGGEAKDQALTFRRWSSCRCHHLDLFNEIFPDALEFGKAAAWEGSSNGSS